MGFWPEIAEVKSKPRAKPTKKAVAKAARIFDPNAVGCDACTLRSYWPTLTTKVMPLSGAVRGSILALAEAPGEEEDKKGEALIGPSGKLLRDNISPKYRNQIAFQNIVRCRPPDNRTPYMEEMHACSIHLDADTAAMPNLGCILGLGGTPLRRYFPGASIMDVHGLKFPVEVNGKAVWYYPVYHPAFVLRGRKENRDNPPEAVFKEDLRRLFESIDTWPRPFVYKITPQDVLLPRTREEAEAIRARMKPPFAVDVETNEHLRPYETNAVLTTAAISDGDITMAWSCNHPEGPTDWGTDFLIDTVCRYQWIAHNAAMELSWFTYYNKTGKELAAYDDTMAAARVLQEREDCLALEQVSHIYLGTNVKAIMKIDTKHIMSYPLSEILPYNGLDAWASARIWQITSPRIKSGTVQSDYQRLINCIQSTTTMELAGLPVDPGEALRLKDSLEKQRVLLNSNARKLYEVRQYEIDTGNEFKITSPKQVGQALHDYGKLDLPNTKSGQYSTDESIIRKYAEQNPLAKAVLNCREIDKAMDYIDPTLEAGTRYPDGLIHPTYTVMFVSTLRLSSRDPNIQNYPVRKHSEIRRMIAILQEWAIRVYGFPVVFLKFDYGQLEARVLAMVSKDKNLCSAIITGFDIHAFWLKEILREHPDYMLRLSNLTGQKEEAKLLAFGRDCIKSDFVFAALYGSNAGGTPEYPGISERTGIPLPIVKKVLGNLWDTYRGVQVWQRERRTEYRKYGSISFPTGRKWRGLFDKSANATINYPIQGTAADIVVEAMNEMSAISRQERNPFLHPRLNLHDDLTFIVPEDQAAQYIEFIHPILTRIRFSFQIVPLTVDSYIANNWCDMEKIAKFEGDYLK